jgi:Ca2+-binding RTX toxin-like protein
VAGQFLAGGSRPDRLGRALRFDGGTMLVGSPAIRIAHDNAPFGGLTVTSLLAWNAIKCIAITDLQGDSLTIESFVDVLVGPGDADHPVNITLDGSNRGKLATSAGDDRIRVLADSNGAAGGDQFVIDSGAGNDLVTVGTSTTDWSAGFSATAYRESWTSSVVTLGQGDDRFEGDGSNDTVFGGDGDDVATLGGGNNLFVGGDGIDTLMLDNAPAQYTFVPTADG